MRIGFISMPLSGHLNPMTALARKLKSRGHETIFIGVPDIEPAVRAAGIDFLAYCEEEFPIGSIAEAYAPLSRLHGLDVTRYACDVVSPGLTKAGLEQLPAKLAEARVEALVIDMIHFFMELVPMSLDMPYVHIWNVLHVDFSATSPACFFSWPYENSPEAVSRNVGGIQLAAKCLQPIVEVGIAYAEKIKLEIDWNDPGATVSKLAVVTQTPLEFDFPGIPWPPQFHYAGPFHEDQGREPIAFPWEKLTGAPLVYASLGTLVNGSDLLYTTILSAVSKIQDIQLVLSVGKNIDLESLGSIPSNAIVVPSAPQIELLKKAALCITHAGLNTVLEALAQGVPMVAIPIGFDQPGVAARIAHHGAGEFIEVEDLTVEKLVGQIEKVLRMPSYREKAHYFQQVIAQTHGLDRAADVIEEAFVKSREVGNLPEVHAVEQI